MEPDPMGSINTHFSDIDDPHIDRTKRHNLLDLLVIPLSAVNSGADKWEEVQLFGEAKQA